MKTYRRVDVYIDISLPRQKLEVIGQLDATTSLPSEKDPPGPIALEAVWIKDRSGLCREEPTGTRTPILQSSSP
jgi:hypothetical protein